MKVSAGRGNFSQKLALICYVYSKYNSQVDMDIPLCYQSCSESSFCIYGAFCFVFPQLNHFGLQIKQETNRSLAVVLLIKNFHLKLLPA